MCRNKSRIETVGCLNFEKRSGLLRLTLCTLAPQPPAMQAAAVPPQVAILQKKVQVLQSKLENQARLHEFDIDDRMQEQAEAAREHTTRIAEAEMAQAEMAGEMDRLRVELHTERLAVAELRAELEECDERDAALEGKLAAAAAAESKSADELKVRVGELEGKLAASRKADKAERAKAAAELQRAKQVAAEHEAEAEEANQQLLDFRARAAEQGEGSEDSLDSLRDELRRTQRAVKKAEKQSEAGAKDCARKDSRIEKLQATIQELREELQNQSFTVPSETTSDGTSDALAELEHKLAKKTKECASLTKKLAAAKKSSGKGSDEVSEAVQEEFAELQAELKTANKESAAKGKKLAAAEKKASASAAQVARLKDANAELEGEVAQLQDEVKRLEKQSDAAPKKKKKKRKEPAVKESPLSLIARTLSAVTHPAVAGAAGGEAEKKKQETQAVQEDDKENEVEEKPAKRRGNVKGRKPRATKAAAEPAAGGRPKRSAGKPKEYWKADAANSSVSFAEESFSKSGTACVPSAVALSPCLLCRVACICGLLESDCFAVALSPCLLCRAVCVRGLPECDCLGGAGRRATSRWAATISRRRSAASTPTRTRA